MEAYWTEVLSFLGGLLGGSLLTLRFTKRQTASDDANLVNQSRAQAGGDITGRDKIGS